MSRTKNIAVDVTKLELVALDGRNGMFTRGFSFFLLQKFDPISLALDEPCCDALCIQKNVFVDVVVEAQQKRDNKITAV